MSGVFALLPAVLLAGTALADHCYRGTAGEVETFTVTGQPTWTPRSVEAGLRPVGGAAGSMGIVLHYQDSSNLYLFLYGTGSMALRIYRKSDGAYILLGSTPLSVPLGQKHEMRAESDGNGLLSLYWDDVLKLSVTDSTFDSGRIGLRVWNMTADFDDVLALDPSGSTLLADDFDDGNADGWSAGAGWTVVAQSESPMPQPVFDTSFEGGNVQVTLVDPPTWTVHVTPELKGSSPYRAWFYFQMSNLSPAQPTNIVFQDVDWLTRPYYSHDNLDWTEFPAPSGNMYSVTFTQDPVWIAHSIPYVTRHEQELIDSILGAYVQATVLATTEGGRPVRLLTITAPDGLTDKRGAWFVARQHAWEASGSWIADALARWLVSPDPQAIELRSKAVVNLITIMDVDNVVLGGSGKDQLPIDLNRDWRETPYWNAVRETIGSIDAFAAAGSYDLFMDLHCPGSASTYLCVEPQSMVSPEYWQRFQEFRQILAATAGSGSLPYAGQYTEMGPSYHPLWNQISFWHQYFVHPELLLSIGLETQTSSLDGYRGLAEGVGRALNDFLPDATIDVAGSAGEVALAGSPFMSLGPNPFRTATALHVQLPRSALVRLTVHDALGRLVRTLAEEVRPPGAWALAWDGRNDAGSPVAAGVYFVRLNAAARSVTDRVTLVR